MRYFILLMITILTQPVLAENGRRNQQPKPKDTLGFEVEFQGELNPLLFPFLDPEVVVEATGNREVRSKVFQNEPDMLPSLKALLQHLGGQRRSIHIHRRIAKGGGDAETIRASALASRLSDIVFLWRLQQAPKIATTYWSQERRSPQGVTTTKGTVFLQNLGNTWDFETRGVFNDPDFASGVSAAFSIFLKKGTDLRPLFDIQSGLFLRKEGLAEYLEKIALATRGYGLKQNEKEAVTALEGAHRYSAILPLYHYEDLPSLSDAERERIAAANEAFGIELLKLVGQTPIKMPERFRGLMSQWANAAGLLEALIVDLERHANKSQPATPAKEFLRDRLQAANESKQERIRSEAEAFARGSGVSNWLRQLILTELLKPQPDKAVLLRLRGVDGPEWEDLLQRIFEHPHVDARKAGAELLVDRAPARVPIDVLKKAILNERDATVKTDLLDAVAGLARKGLNIHLNYSSEPMPTVRGRNLPTVGGTHLNCSLGLLSPNRPPTEG